MCIIMPMVAKTHRCHLIERILEEERIGNQAELLERLRKHGIVITQATLSRDLSAIGVVKGPRGYQLAGAEPEPRPADSEHFASALRQHLRWVTSAGSLAVLTTPTGHAPSLGVELDRARLSQAVGTIAGDDTIFVACRDAVSARQLCDQLRRLAGLESASGNGSRRRTAEGRRA
ncbi:MAG: arginine repressor [Phycisphaerae bacterium]|nr:arginine repressor [Phycisphaerae bacterium]